MMALIKGVYDLKAFQEAYSLILDIGEYVDKMPNHEQYSGIASQIRRASTSVCANLVEGFAKNSYKAELRRFVRISLGSAEEMNFWLKLATDKKYIPAEQGRDFQARYTLVSRLLKGLDNSLTNTIKHTKNSTEEQTLNTEH